MIGIGGVSLLNNNLLNKIDTTFAWDAKSIEENDAEIYKAMTNRNYVMEMVGIYQYTYRSYMVSSGLEDEINNNGMYKELEEYYSEMVDKEQKPNEMTGIFEGKNLFFIMLESIDTWMLTEDYMPNLYQLQQESINFVNHYSPLYLSAATFNTDFVANTSLIPAENGVDINVYKNNAFPFSLANQFKKNGYTVYSYHSSSPTIYDRGDIHVNLGYYKYHSWEEMNMENYMLDSQMMNGYTSMISYDKFLSFVITYSGHGPYNKESIDIAAPHLKEAKEKVSLQNLEKYNISSADKSEYTYAIAQAMETDLFIGELLTQLEKDGFLEDTVLVFFTDHYAKYMTNHELLKEIKDVDNTDLLCNTPFFIYQSRQPGQTVDKVSSTIDILPTVLNMFGIQNNHMYYMGHDVFSTEENKVIFPGGNWYDGEIYYTPDFEEELTEYIEDVNKDVENKIKYSKYIMKSDYFLHLEEKE